MGEVEVVICDGVVCLVKSMLMGMGLVFKFEGEVLLLCQVMNNLFVVLVLDVINLDLVSVLGVIVSCEVVEVLKELLLIECVIVMECLVCEIVVVKIIDKVLVICNIMLMGMIEFNIYVLVGVKEVQVKLVILNWFIEDFLFEGRVCKEMVFVMVLVFVEGVCGVKVNLVMVQFGCVGDIWIVNDGGIKL